VDFGYLEGFAGGDAAVVSEVLRLFLEQAAAWRPRLEASDAGVMDVLHTIKGSARGVGANALAGAAEAAESDLAQLPQVRAALDVAASEMAAYLDA
jgi:HPt (histidine-containing phosphotransfer) domain-containing protein